MIVKLTAIELNGVKPLSDGSEKSVHWLSYINDKGKEVRKDISAVGKLAPIVEKLREGQTVELVFVENVSNGRTYKNIVSIVPKAAGTVAKTATAKKEAPAAKTAYNGAPKKDWDANAKGQQIGNAISNAVLLVVHGKEKDLEAAAIKIMKVGNKLREMDFSKAESNFNTKELEELDDLDEEQAKSYEPEIDNDEVF
jgi:seryl-tRNA synthetase